ncbi:MAG: segregation and condensation protein A [Mycoplasma sp.]
MNSKLDNQENSSKIPAISFKIDAYDGPLDLLVELIKDRKMDILTIDISELCFQYLNFINENLSLNKIDEISEYLVMASYLIELKSKKILSILQDDEDDETELEIDRLRRQLFLYKQYKDVVSKFKTRQSERVKFLAKPCDDFEEYIPKDLPEAPLPESVPIQKLIKFWRKILLDKASEEDVDFTFSINVKTIDIEELQTDLVSFIEETNVSNIDFEEFTTIFKKDSDLEYKCAIFFSLLHLAKNQIIKLEQDDVSKKIFITKNDQVAFETIHDEIHEAISKQQEISKLMQQQLHERTKINRDELRGEEVNDEITDEPPEVKKEKSLQDAIEKLINGSAESDDDIDDEAIESDDDDEYDEYDEDDIDDEEDEE